LSPLPLQSVNLGDTVQITCSGGSSYYAWFQQKTPGTGPVTVIYSNDKRPSGIPSRFSGSLSGTTSTLTITGVQAVEEAVYYCGSLENHRVAGGGKHLSSIRSPLSPYHRCHPLNYVPKGHIQPSLERPQGW
uniref:Ig-like domain-containing protein n=1 Tax=Anser cygnoides TaxID=8845 RepID=A0A8B9D0H3_ANSCY